MNDHNPQRSTPSIADLLEAHADFLTMAAAVLSKSTVTIGEALQADPRDWKQTVVLIQAQLVEVEQLVYTCFDQVLVLNQFATTHRVLDASRAVDPLVTGVVTHVTELAKLTNSPPPPTGGSGPLLPALRAGSMTTEKEDEPNGRGKK